MPRPGVVAAPVLAMGLVVTPHASGQSTASAQAGVGTVRFAGGATTSLLSLSPDFSVTGPNRQMSVGATVAAVPHSTGYGELHLTTWVAAAVAGRWQLASDVAVAGATLGGGRASGTGSITGEALYLARRWGVAIGGGPTSGWITEVRPVTALHARLRGWWSDGAGGTSLAARVEPQRFLGAWFADVSGEISRRQGRFSAQVAAAGRISSTYVSRAAGLVSVDLQLTSAWTFNLVGGNVLPDPYQGFPATGVLLAGVRFQLPPSRSTTQVVRGSGFAVTRTADGVMLEYERRGAQNVSVLGDWNSWLPAPLNSPRPDRWRMRLSLPPGVYHFMLLVDGNSWTIPPGAPSVSDGLGGRVAVLVVTP